MNSAIFRNEATASIVNLKRMLEQQVQEISNLQEANEDWFG
jgi:hypothetical protein